MTNPVELTKAIDRWKTSPPKMRKAYHSSALAMALNMADERDTLKAKLETRWNWLNANPGHDQFVEREDAVLEDLKRYEALEDALANAANALLGDAA